MNCRFSSSSIGRISAVIDGERKFLLGVNKNRFDNGMKSLSPIGGGIEFDDSSRSFLVDDLDAQLQSGNDLRFTTHREHVSVYRSWLITRMGREIDMLREIQEELFVEPGFLSNDNPVLGGDMDDHLLAHKFVSIHHYEYVTNRAGFEKQITLGFFELYDIELLDSSINHLISMSKDNDSRFKFVSKGEIEQGGNDDGWGIAPNARILISDEFIIKS